MTVYPHTPVSCSSNYQTSMTGSYLIKSENTRKHETVRIRLSGRHRHCQMGCQGCSAGESPPTTRNQV